MQGSISAERMSECEVVDRADRFWWKVLGEFGKGYILTHGLSFDDAYDAVIYPQYEVILEKNVDLGVDDFGVPILGQYLPKEMTALVDRKIVATDDPRLSFVSWHEASGHGVLQGKYLKECSGKIRKLYDTDPSMRLIENAFESQANLFARHTAAPIPLVWVAFKRVFGISRKIPFCGPGVYMLNGRKEYAESPIELAWKVAQRMRHYFGGLSAECLAYQLIRIAVDPNGYDQGDPLGPYPTRC